MALSNVMTRSLISASSSMEQVKAQHAIKSQMDGKVGVLEAGRYAGFRMIVGLRERSGAIRISYQVTAHAGGTLCQEKRCFQVKANG